ncbi:hypothetical protein SLA2020_426540 [Shorea laevis]
MSWAGPEDVLLSTSLASYLDKKLLVLLRDGRKLMGLLCSFDQFANVVLQDACERVIVGDIYCDIPLGLYVIRGENVVLIGELDLDKEELPPHMTRVSEAEIKRPYMHVITSYGLSSELPSPKFSNDGSESRKGCYRSEGHHEKRMEFLDFD